MPGHLSPLIGRERELERLRQAVEAAAGGESAFVLVVGEAGIGKTRLLSAACEMAASRGLRVLHGVSIESGGGLPFLPLLAPLKACVGDAPGIAQEPPARRLVRSALLGRRREGSSDGTREDGAAAARLVDAIHDVLTAEPTVLVIDDVQWADASTVTVLDYLAHRALDAPIAVIAAARDDERDAIEGLPIADERRFVQIPVARLSRDEVAVQVAGIDGVAPDPARVDGIFARAGGNPFFVEQVVATTNGAEDGRTPHALRSLVLRRLSGLSETARASFEALAILERPAAPDLIAAVAALDATLVREGLAEAERAGVAVPTELGVGLRHPLFGEVVRDELSGPARRELHGRAADALPAGGGSLADVAEHAWRAAQDERAWTTALAAADDAWRSLAFAEAALHLERALRVWPEGRAGRASAGLRAARAKWMLGEPAAALAHARDAERALDHESGSEITLLDILLAQGAFAWDAGERAAAADLFERARDLVSDSTPPGPRGRALWGLGRAAVARGRHADAEAYALEARPYARKAGERGSEAEDLLLAGMIRASAGADGTGIVDEGRRIALASGAPSVIGHAFQFAVDLFALAGDPERALVLALEGVEATERLGLARTHAADLRVVPHSWNSRRVTQPELLPSSKALSRARSRRLPGRG